jgi:hypothetical protein
VDLYFDPEPIPESDEHFIATHPLPSATTNARAGMIPKYVHLIFRKIILWFPKEEGNDYV